MQPLSTHSSLGINVPRVSHTLSPAWLMASVSHPSPNPISSSPEGLGRSFPFGLSSHCSNPALTAPESLWDTICYGEARSHFSTLNILLWCPLHPQPSWQQTPQGFFPPGAVVSSALVGTRCRSALAGLPNPELHTEHLQPGSIQGVGKGTSSEKTQTPF